MYTLRRCRRIAARSQLSGSEGRPKSNDGDSKKCPICLEEPKVCEWAKIDECGHEFCFTCIDKWGNEIENTCPICKRRFTVFEQVNQNKKRKRSKRVQTRDQRKTRLHRSVSST